MHCRAHVRRGRRSRAGRAGGRAPSSFSRQHLDRLDIRSLRVLAAQVGQVELVIARGAALAVRAEDTIKLVKIGDVAEHLNDCLVVVADSRPMRLD
eukprot:6239882-Prymnesium_polylepis.1